MIKVLQIIPSLAKGGAERLVIDICNELSKRQNIRVKLVILNNINDFKFLTENIDIEVCSAKVIPSITRKSIVRIEDFIRIVNSFNPDIIHSHLYEAEILSREYIFRNVKYFTHFHNNINQFRKISFKDIFDKKSLTDFYERNRLFPKYLKCKNNFICISDHTFNYANKILPEKLRNIFLLNNAIDFKRFNRNYYPQNYKIINKKKYKLVTVGSLLDNKNHVFLIDVVKNLHQKGHNLSLDIIGGGPNYNMLNNKIISENLTDKVFLKGSVDDVEEYLKNAYIYVHSAISEAFGLVLLEAMAAGLPVVVLDSGGVNDIVYDGYNGYIINLSDLNEFSDKIIELIQNDQLYENMSVNAIETAKKFDISIYVDKLLEIYRSVMD